MLFDLLETDELLAPEVIAEPHRYFGLLRENDPVHWNPLFKTWIVTRHKDVVWLIRNHELFSSVPPPWNVHEAYPPIDEADWELLERLRPYQPLIAHDSAGAPSDAPDDSSLVYPQSS